MGTTGTEFGAQVEKKEPDFLICCNGKWGVLEVMGAPYHQGPVQTANDHKRFRRFKDYGLFFHEAWDSDECIKDPVAVVDRFLKLLASHK
jgi:hypothetical protein